MERVDYCADCEFFRDCDYAPRRFFDESVCVDFEPKQKIAKNTEQANQPDSEQPTSEEE